VAGPLTFTVRTRAGGGRASVIWLAPRAVPSGEEACEPDIRARTHNEATSWPAVSDWLRSEPNQHNQLGPGGRSYLCLPPDPWAGGAPCAWCRGQVCFRARQTPGCSPATGGISRGCARLDYPAGVGATRQDLFGHGGFQASLISGPADFQALRQRPGEARDSFSGKRQRPGARICAREFLKAHRSGV
jgi:hypothetical protein